MSAFIDYLISFGVLGAIALVIYGKATHKGLKEILIEIREGLVGTTEHAV